MLRSGESAEQRLSAPDRRDDLPDCLCGGRGVFLVRDKSFVGGAVDDAVHAVGGQGGQVVLCRRPGRVVPHSGGVVLTCREVEGDEGDIGVGERGCRLSVILKIALGV